MINFRRGNSRMEMLRNFLIFCLCIVAANAESKFYVLTAPDSLKFSGTETLGGEEVGAVALASTGTWISNDATWNGLYIKDPFNLPSLAVVVHIEAAPEIAVSAPVKEYPVTGNKVAAGLLTISEHANSGAESQAEICDINFNEFNAAVKALKACFPAVEVPTSVSLDSLDMEQPQDKLVLDTVGAINAMAENADKLEKSTKFVVIRFSFDGLKQSHSEALQDALPLMSKAINNLKEKIAAAKTNHVVFFAIATESALSSDVTNDELSDSAAEQLVRKRREVIKGSTLNPNNLAVYYNQDYPVIFNIILWFMVAFGLSLLAICYAIGDMDPGRDSIIYRMTSTRMKKDN